MDYTLLDQQYNQMQQQTQSNLNTLQQVSGKISSLTSDSITAREINMDLRGIAISLQQQQQSLSMLLQTMSQRIQQLEMQVQGMNQQGVGSATQQRAWNTSPQSQPNTGSGFLGNVMTGLGLGVGFSVADNIVDDIFDEF